MTALLLFFQEKDLSLSGEHVREGLTCIVSVKVPNPEFEGQTKVFWLPISTHFIFSKEERELLGMFCDSSSPVKDESYQISAIC